jgi:intein-encoded DNA endonuclease-like protein
MTDKRKMLRRKRKKLPDALLKFIEEFNRKVEESEGMLDGLTQEEIVEYLERMMQMERTVVTNNG